MTFLSINFDNFYLNLGTGPIKKIELKLSEKVTFNSIITDFFLFSSSLSLINTANSTLSDFKVEIILFYFSTISKSVKS